MTKHAFDLLTGARALLTPQTWTKGVHARDKDQGEVQPTDTTACRFCLSGALFAVEQTSPRGAISVHHLIADDLLDDAAGKLFPLRRLGPFSAFVNVNDHADTTLDDVYAVLDAAIEKAKVS